MSKTVDVSATVTGVADGPAVVLSNSLGSTHRMWDAQLAALEERFRVVRYDTRGHGDSPVVDGPYRIHDLVGDVVALLDRLEIDRAHFIGLSLGGMTGMRLAATHPDRVNRLVLLCTAVNLPPASGWTDRAATVRENGVASIATAVVDRWFTPAYLEANPDRREYYEQMVASTPAEGYAGCCEAIAELDLAADLARITAPTLSIAGDDDPATPPARLAEIADGVADGRLLVAEQARHLANAEQPAIVTPAIIAHLEDS